VTVTAVVRNVDTWRGFTPLGLPHRPRPDATPAAATLKLTAPVACPEFTVRFEAPAARSVKLAAAGKSVPLARAESARDLAAGGWRLQGKELTACFDLSRGESTLEVE